MDEEKGKQKLREKSNKSEPVCERNILSDDYLRKCLVLT